MVEAGTANIAMGRVRMVEGWQEAIFGCKLVIVDSLPTNPVTDQAFKSYSQPVSFQGQIVNAARFSQDL
jgi:hypothetical protein